MLFALFLALAGYQLHGELAQRQRDEVGSRLQAVAEAKARHIRNWLDERMANARISCQGSLLAHEAVAWLDRGSPAGAGADALRQQLRLLRDTYGYQSIALFDATGLPVLATGDEMPIAPHGTDARLAMAARRPLLVDVHRHDQGAPAALGIAAPVYPEGAQVRARGALYFAMRGEDFLFDLLKNGLVLDHRIETRLLRAQGEWIQHLNTPGPDARMPAGLQASRPQLASARALRGERGLIEGALDEQEHAVLAWATAIPGTPWLLIAQQDEATLRAPLSRLTASVVVGGAALFLMTNLLVWLWWRQAEYRQWARMLQERLSHQTLEQRYADLSRYANDIILLADEAGRIVDANERAIEAYGYPRETLQGLPLSALRAAGGDNDYAEDMTRLAQDGRLRYEAMHRTLGGETFPVEVSASLIEADGRCYHQKIVRDISERKTQEARIHQLAYFDELTGLPNRGLLKDRLDQAAARCRREALPLAVLFLDLDHFKHVNDSLGHAAGDSLLREIARRLSACARAEDTVARLGGDEFVLLLRADARGAARVAEKLIALLSEPCVVERHTLRVAASIGIALCPEDGDDHESLLRAADTALVLAKQTGRGTYRFFTPQMQDRAARRLEIEAALRQALERDELSLHYQPQVDAASGRIVGAEALIRWHHPAWGWVAPAEFIPVAEETGIIVDLGDWVLETAIAQAAAWRRDGLPPIGVAVNLSVVQFREADLVERVLAQLAHHGLPPGALEIEVTESVAMREAALTEPLLRQFTEAGIALAIDDFGTGYSSLASLKHFRVSLLKIDSSFVAGLPADTENGAIVSAVMQMGAALGARTLAEGVETAMQFEWLRAHGCQLIQGYHISRPLPPEAFADLLQADPGEAAAPVQISRSSLA